jgi:hypothetical protein
MLLTAKCLYCKETRNPGPFDVVDHFCSPACRETFEDLAGKLLGGSNCAAEGVDSESPLGRALIDAVRMQRYRALRAQYNYKAAERESELRSDAERRRSRNEVVRRYRGW